MKVNILLIAEKGKSGWEKLKIYLQQKGYMVQIATTVGKAYRIIRNEPVHIVLSEYLLSRSNGLSFLKKAKAIKPHIEIIFISERATLANAIEAMKEGAYDFYQFPVDVRIITAVIEKAMEKQTIFVQKVELERKVQERFKLCNITGRSKAMEQVIEIASSVASKNVNILLTGETGTGKEMIANAIHYNSPRASRPFVKINCAAFNDGVLESELFGHERGAFTGAVTRRIGRFELAHTGTLFLDEIGDIQLSTQIKLLRVLQERAFERVGGNNTIKVDVRIIAATHQDLKKLIMEGKFREDLYYRLNVVHIELPTLIERLDDIPLLASSFIHKLSEEKGYRIRGITQEAMQMLMNYHWPGNVRELENAVESAMALAEGELIEAGCLPPFMFMNQEEAQNNGCYKIPYHLTLREMEREIIRLTLDRTGGNKTRASQLLNIGLRTLQRKMKEFDIEMKIS